VVLGGGGIAPGSSPPGAGSSPLPSNHERVLFQCPWWGSRCPKVTSSISSGGAVGLVSKAVGR